jgi:lactate permease
MPFVVAALGLVGLGWSASMAGGASLGVAMLGAVVWPDLEAAAVPGALFVGLGTSAQVLYVLFGGLLLYNLLSAGGAVDGVSRFLGGLEPDRVALAAGVAPFFESVTGFGVAVVISAPTPGFPGLLHRHGPTWLGPSDPLSYGEVES